jgi:hypothetical protein
LYIDPDPGTPAGSYTTASGFDYSTPVPEPSTLAMGIMGMLGLVAMLLRRHRR